MKTIGMLRGSVTFCLSFATLVALVGQPPEVAAQDRRDRSAPPDSTEQVFDLAELVVTATRTGQLIRDLPVNVNVVGQEFIRSQAVGSVPDLLRTLPGVTMRDYQATFAAHPTRQAPSIRGLSGGTAAGRTLVLLDGVPMADPFAGWVHWAQVPLDLVDRVEIVRGGGSGVWGSRSLGGVINIRTLRPERSRAQLSMTAGNLGTKKTSGVLRHVGQRFSVSVMGEYFDTEGFIGIHPDFVSVVDVPAGSTHGVGYADVRYDVSPGFQLFAGAHYLDEERRDGSALRKVDVSLAGARAGFEATTAGGSLWRLTLFGTDQETSAQFTAETPDRSSESLSLDQFSVPATSGGSNLQWSKETGAHELSLGSDLLVVDGEVNEEFFYIGGEAQRYRRVGGSQTLLGAYVQDVFKPSPTLRVLASARVDRASWSDGNRYIQNLDNGADLVDTDFDGSDESVLSLSLGVRKEVGQGVAVRGNVFRSYRAPTLNELYKPFREPGNVVAESNDQLAPERALGGEIGMDYQSGSTLLLRLTGFWTRLSDPIVEATLGGVGQTGGTIAPCGFVPPNGVCRQRRNLDVFRSAGIEAELEYRPVREWAIGGSYIWNPTRVVEAGDFPDLEGNWGSRTPRHALTGRVQWLPRTGLRAAVSGRYVGSRFEDDLNALEIDSFFLMDLTASYRLGDRWEAYGSVENVFDEAFVTARPTALLSRSGAPRMVLAGLRVIL